MGKLWVNQLALTQIGGNGWEWDNLPQFAQKREEFNNVAREEEKSKKKVVRELLILKCSINYDRGTTNEDDRKSQGQNSHSSKVPSKCCR